MAVVDGSTSKTNYRVQPDITNGQLATILIRDYLQSVDSSAPHLSCKELCEGLTEHFQQEYLVRNVDIDALTIHPELRPTASVVVFSRCRQEVWLIGDCQCMINGQRFENPKPHEATIARKRARLIIGGMSPDEARRCIEHDLITAMHEGQNKNYAVIDGFPIYYAGVAIIKLREWATTFPFQIVRLHGNIARIEIPVSDFAAFLEKREEITEKLKAMGFSYITLDMEGFRSGSMDETLQERKVEK